MKICTKINLKKKKKIPKPVTLQLMLAYACAKRNREKSTHNHCNMKMKKTSTFDFFPKQIKAQNFSQGSFKCPNRSVSCGNNGALATHMKANHSNQKDAGTIFKYVLDCKAV